MRDAEYYRAQSEFYAEIAETIKRPDYQDRWLRLAQQWRELAEQADKQHEAIRHSASVTPSIGGLWGYARFIVRFVSAPHFGHT